MDQQYLQYLREVLIKIDFKAITHSKIKIKNAHYSYLLCVSLHGHMHAEGNFRESILFYHDVGSRDLTQDPRLGNKCSYLLNYLTNPINSILFIL